MQGPIKDNSGKHLELKREPVALDSGQVLIQDAAGYPEGWDMDHFKSLPTYAARGRYAKEKLGKLGQGSARIVFEIDDDTVLKLARNEKGLAQNELEAEVSATDWYDFVAKVHDAEPNNLWIEMEKARKMKKSDFKRLTGFKFDDFVNFISNEAEANAGRNRGGYLRPVNPDAAEEISETDLFNDIVSFVHDYDILPGDFERTSSWGIVERQGHEVPVLIDYGISRSIYNDFYVKKY